MNKHLPCHSRKLKLEELMTIQTNVTALPGGFALTGFVDVEKLLTIHCTPGNVTYELETTSNGVGIFTTNGEVSPISTSQLICYCS